ncbi:MAG TPA: PilN domain-containing protein [Kofleriaceae bacterium]|nr:PilN domain-containing protein [Kofleriaceae bacterium]
MIRINLLPHRKAKRAAEPGRADLGIGVAALAAAAALVFFVFHEPAVADRDRAHRDLEEEQRSNDRLRQETKDLPELRAVVEAQDRRESAIRQLLGTVVVPDNLMHELGEILTPGHMPTMTREMQARISDGPQGDPNRRFALDWDPKHVWLTAFTLKGDDFTLEGGAQSEADVPQLAKRMQASVYFDQVTSPTSLRVDDKTTGISYYKFTITGKVVF